MNPSAPFAATLIAALLLLVLVLGLGWWWSSQRLSRASRRRTHRALDGERDAEMLLRRAGFRVLDRQVSALGWMEIDGVDVEFTVRADLLVERVEAHPSLPIGARLVAEVKTGRLAPDPTYPATRRQLLEYQRVFGLDGLLLVDVQAGDIMEIAFPA